MFGIKKVYRHFLSIVLLFLLIVVGLIHTISKDFLSRKKTDVNTPEGIMLNVVAIQMGSNGYPAQRLVSPKLINYKDNNVTYVMTPNVTIYQGKQPPWKITADYGKATNGIQKIYFWQNVIMQQDSSRFGPASVITTDHFTVITKTNEGYTDAPVKFVRSDMIATGLGAQTNFKKKEIHLLADVKSIYTVREIDEKRKI